MKLKILRSKKGEGYIDAVIIVFVVILLIALVVRVTPVFIAKSRLDTFANELIRTAEIEGRVGTETTARANELKAQTGINPTITWSKTGNIQLNQEVDVNLTTTVNIGLFDGFGSFPITLRTKATGKSEVYHK